MSNISIRKLDSSVLQLLRVRAATKGLSMEEEIRRTLTDSVSSPTRIGDLAVQTFGEAYGVELSIEKQPDHAPPELLE